MTSSLVIVRKEKDISNQILRNLITIFTSQKREWRTIVSFFFCFFIIKILLIKNKKKVSDLEFC